MRLASVSLALLLVACTTPLQRGEQLYREGDPVGALAVWRAIPADALDGDEARRRVEQVEDEYQQLVVRYEQRGRYYERRDRLAEAIQNYRLALKLRPDDAELLAHVQELSRTLVARKTTAQHAFDVAFAAEDFAAARAAATQLHSLDPTDPEVEATERRLDGALRGRVEGLLAEGRRAFAAGDYAVAEKRFRDVLVLAPGEESAQGYLAYIQQIRSSRVARTTPRAPEPRSVRPAPAEAEAGPLEATEAQIRAEGFHQNALAAERAGDPYAAIAADLRALDADPRNARARAHLEKLRAKLQPDVETLIDSGRAAFQQEDLQGAIDLWRRALLVDPDNARAQQYVARAERLLENLEQLRADPTVKREGRQP